MTVSLKFYNTMSAEKEVFEPLVPDTVTMYVCGPTVYNLAHIGNARPVVVFDTLFRLLQTHFSSVTYARNITDIDDKIITAAKEGNRSIDDVTEQYTAIYREDMADLNTLPPSLEPHATHNIDAMIELTETLISKGVVDNGLACKRACVVDQRVDRDGYGLVTCQQQRQAGLV